jgi:hypothetical protein
MFPGFRVMAMSMYGLEIDRAGVASIPIDMVDLQLVSLVEEQSTVGAALALLFDQGGQSRTARRVLPASFTPIHPIPCGKKIGSAYTYCISQRNFFDGKQLWVL